MADAPDPYATAKANLRDTIKWLATSLAAVGAAVIAGASLSGLSGLEGGTLTLALFLGGVGLLAILGGIAILISLLTSNVFYFSDLAAAGDPIGDEINMHASDILSPQTPTIADLIQFRATAVTDMAASAPGQALYDSAYKRWSSANDLIARVTNLGQFMKLRRDFANSQGLLFLLTIVVIGSLGGYALLAGSKSSAPAEVQKVLLKPGERWLAAGDSLAKACGSEPLNATLLGKKPFDGWVTVRLSAPGKCSGLELSVPASLVEFVGPGP